MSLNIQSSVGKFTVSTRLRSYTRNEKIKTEEEFDLPFTLKDKTHKVKYIFQIVDRYETFSCHSCNALNTGRIFYKLILLNKEEKQIVSFHPRCFAAVRGERPHTYSNPVSRVVNFCDDKIEMPPFYERQLTLAKIIESKSDHEKLIDCEKNGFVTLRLKHLSEIGKDIFTSGPKQSFQTLVDKTKNTASAQLILYAYVQGVFSYDECSEYLRIAYKVKHNAFQIQRISTLNEKILVGLPTKISEDKSLESSEGLSAESTPLAYATPSASQPSSSPIILVPISTQSSFESAYSEYVIDSTTSSTPIEELEYELLHDQSSSITTANEETARFLLEASFKLQSDTPYHIPPNVADETYFSYLDHFS